MVPADREKPSFMADCDIRVAEVKALKTRAGNIMFHEQQREDSRNVYLDDIEPLADDVPEHSENADEVAWKTAIDAAPYLLSTEAADEETSPQELFDKLQPLKELVAEDIERSDDDAG